MQHIHAERFGSRRNISFLLAFISILHHARWAASAVRRSHNSVPDGLFLPIGNVERSQCNSNAPTLKLKNSEELLQGHTGACRSDVKCFGNLGGLGPNISAPQELRYEGIGSYNNLNGSKSTFDLVVTSPSSGANQYKGLPLENGIVTNSESFWDSLGIISVGNADSSTQETVSINLTFSFVKHHGDPQNAQDIISPFDFDFYVLDIDHESGGKEEFQLFSPAECVVLGSYLSPVGTQDDFWGRRANNDLPSMDDSYTMCTGSGNLPGTLKTQVNVTMNSAGIKTFGSTVTQSRGNDPQSTNISIPQQAISVLLKFRDTSKFTLQYTVVTDSTRNFLFGVDSNLLTSCSPTLSPTSQPTSVFVNPSFCHTSSTAPIFKLSESLLDTGMVQSNCMDGIQCFGNLGGHGPQYTETEEIRYTAVGAFQSSTGNSIPMDLVVSASGQGLYQYFGDGTGNGLINKANAFGVISLGPLFDEFNTVTVDFDFTFVRSGGNPSNPADCVPPFDFDFYVFDLDQSQNGYEEFQLFGNAQCVLPGSPASPVGTRDDFPNRNNDNLVSFSDSYNICSPTGYQSGSLRSQVNVTMDSNGIPVFRSSVVQGTANDPVSSNLTFAQQALTVIFQMTATNTFTVRYTVADSSTRRFIFGSEANVLGTCAPTASPSIIPSNSPTSSSPTAQPTTSVPSTSPTTSAPSESPTTGIPTQIPSYTPSFTPTSAPSHLPTMSLPTSDPTYKPTFYPTDFPTISFPTRSPSAQPTDLPSRHPTVSPTTAPTEAPTVSQPTSSPSTSPSSTAPSRQPTLFPTTSPSLPPTASTPSQNPTPNPTVIPSSLPTTSLPTVYPTIIPTSSAPTMAPSTSPSMSPSNSPTMTPSFSSPTSSPTVSPSQANPTSSPTILPTVSPSTSAPSNSPTMTPSFSSPTSSPTVSPSQANPTSSPTILPTVSAPTNQPSRTPTSSSPTHGPSSYPTYSSPTSSPTCCDSFSDVCSFFLRSDGKSMCINDVNVYSLCTCECCSMLSPTQAPSIPPTMNPTTTPSYSPTVSQPTSHPSLSPSSSAPSSQPTLNPTEAPSTSPTSSIPTLVPTKLPSVIPSSMPTSTRPTTHPTESPTSSSPTITPSGTPSMSPITSVPSASPSRQPSMFPTYSAPTASPTNTPTFSSPTSAPTCCDATTPACEVFLGSAAVDGQALCLSDPDVVSLCTCKCCQLTTPSLAPTEPPTMAPSISACGCSLDVMYLLDASDALSQSQFESEVLEFVIAVSRNLGIGNSGSRVAVSTFAGLDDGLIEIPLNNNYSMNELADRIRQVNHIGRDSYLDSALEITYSHMQDHKISEHRQQVLVSVLAAPFTGRFSAASPFGNLIWRSVGNTSLAWNRRAQLSLYPGMIGYTVRPLGLLTDSNASRSFEYLKNSLLLSSDWNISTQRNLIDVDSSLVSAASLVSTQICEEVSNIGICRPFLNGEPCCAIGQAEQDLDCDLLTSDISAGLQLCSAPTFSELCPCTCCALQARLAYH